MAIITSDRIRLTEPTGPNNPTPPEGCADLVIRENYPLLTRADGKSVAFKVANISAGGGIAVAEEDGDFTISANGGAVKSYVCNFSATDFDDAGNFWIHDGEAGFSFTNSIVQLRNSAGDVVISGLNIDPDGTTIEISSVPFDGTALILAL
jgi:hypothetical protein